MNEEKCSKRIYECLSYFVEYNSVLEELVSKNLRTVLEHLANTCAFSNTEEEMTFYKQLLEDYDNGEEISLEGTLVINHIQKVKKDDN